MHDRSAVMALLSERGLTVRHFDRPTPTSAAAAEAIGCSVAEIAKSVLMMVGRQPVMVVASGDCRIKSGKLKKACELGGRARLPEPDEVRRHTGYAPGAVSPFLLPAGLPVLLDRSLQRFPVVYPAAGDDRSAVAVSFAELQQLCGGRPADVCEINT